MKIENQLTMTCVIVGALLLYAATSRILTGTNPTSYMYTGFTGNLTIRLTTVIFITTAFIFILTPLYRGKAVWILGFTWGTIEGSFNIEREILYPQLVWKYASNEWLIYLAAVAVFFVISLNELKHDLRKDRTIAIGASMMILAWLWCLMFPIAFTAQQRSLSNVLELEIGGDAIAMIATVMLFRRVRSWPGPLNMAQSKMS